MACVAGQRFSLADAGNGQQLAQRGARGQVIADEAGPAPAHGQPGCGRVSRQGGGEAGDEVLAPAVRRAGPEQVTAARAGGQPGSAPGILRRGRHPPRGRPGDLDDEPAAAPGDVAAASRHKLTGAAPGPEAERHYGQRRGAFRRVTLGGRGGGQPGALGRRVRRGRFRTRKRRCPLPRLAVHRPGEPVQDRPAGAAGGRQPPAQACHAERLDHVVVQQELRALRDPPRRTEPGQPPQRRGGHRPPAAQGPYIQWTRTVNAKTVTRTLAQSQYDAYAGWFANARRLRSLTAELEALSLQEMARAEGWARITPGTQAPARTKLVRAPKHPRTPGDQPA